VEHSWTALWPRNEPAGLSPGVNLDWVESRGVRQREAQDSRPKACLHGDAA